MLSEHDSEAQEENMCQFEEPKDCTYDENLELLQEYVNQMAYRPSEPRQTKKRISELAKPTMRNLQYVYENFSKILPAERRARLRRLSRDDSAMTTEQFEKILRRHRARERANERRQLKKQEIFYELLQKLEAQCRRQYLNVMLKKFADFVSKLATTMRIPPGLVDPYARMQRGLFCNILNTIGLQPMEQTAVYYNTDDANKYEVAHKLAHALLSLIIKALDEAATTDPNEVDLEAAQEYDWDKYMKNRLMCAADKKCRQLDNCKKKSQNNDKAAILRKCEKYDSCYEYM